MNPIDRLADYIRKRFDTNKSFENLVTNLKQDKMNFRTRKLIKPEDLNGRGTLFGGRVLSWIDEEAAIFAMCQLGNKNIVTKAMSEINFISTAKTGDIAEIGCELVSLGTTSITLCCEVRNKDTKKTIIKVDKIVFVLLDEEGKPKAHNKKK
jgi:acyl-CoA hydrolase